MASGPTGKRAARCILSLLVFFICVEGLWPSKVWALAQDTRIRISTQFVEISLDLNCNLRTRNKETNSYLDACDLLQGGIEELKLVQLNDNRIIDNISRTLTAISEPPSEWQSDIFFPYRVW